jgi:type VI secretion system protein ImpG
VPRGTELDSEAVAGESCRFRTCYPATIWPIALDAASLTGRPLVAPPNPRAPGAMGTLRLSLRCLDPQMSFTKLAPDTLRFFLRGQPQQVFPLYELLFNNTVSVALADGPNDPSPVLLPAGAVRPVGFAADEGMLPYPARSFLGYRLLTEYFAFPEKFLFFDVTGLSAKTLIEAGNKLDIFFYFNRSLSELERSVSAENFALGCTPIVNLFRQRAEPIPLSHAVHEYRVVPDARRPGATEVFSVDRVSAAATGGDSEEYQPFYSLRHGGADAGTRRFWHAARRPAENRDRGTEVFLSFVDLDFNPSAPPDRIASVETTCLNRDLPARLPYGGGHPTFEFVEGAAAVQRVLCMTPPTATLRPAGGPGGRWRLVSHLTLNHFSLVDGADGAEA